MIRDEIRINPDAPAELLEPERIQPKYTDKRLAGEKMIRFEQDMAKEA